MERAIPLVVRDEKTGKLVVCAAAKERFAGLQDEVGIVGINGPCRNYKSFLANYALVGQSVFPVGSTTEYCTKGIMIAPNPIKRGQVSYLVLDAEGIQSFESSMQDSQLMGMMYFFCSVFIYNTKAVDQTNLSALELLTKTAQKIKHANPDLDDLPLFVWALRDWSLSLPLSQSGSGEMSEDEYVRTVLDAPSSSKKRKATPETSQTEFSEMKKFIRDSFRDIHGCMFPTPSSDTKVLQKLSTLQETTLSKVKSKINPKFREKSASFQQWVDKNVTVKTYCGKPLTGSLFIQLVTHCVEAFNTEQIPNLRSAYSYMAELSCVGAEKHAMAVLQLARKFERKYVKTNVVCPSMMNEFFHKLRNAMHKQFFATCYEPQSKKAKTIWQEGPMVKLHEFQAQVNQVNSSARLLSCIQEVVHSGSADTDMKQVMELYQKFVSGRRESLERYLKECPNSFAWCQEVTSVQCQSSLIAWLQVHVAAKCESLNTHQIHLRKTQELSVNQEEQCKKAQEEVKKYLISAEEHEKTVQQLRNQQELDQFSIESSKKNEQFQQREIEALKVSLNELTTKLTEQGEARVEIESWRSKWNAAVTNSQDLEKQIEKRILVEKELENQLQTQLHEHELELADQKAKSAASHELLGTQLKQLRKQVKTQAGTMEFLTQKQQMSQQSVEEYKRVAQECTAKLEALQEKYRQDTNQYWKDQAHVKEEKTQLLLQVQDLKSKQQHLTNWNSKLREEIDKSNEFKEKCVLLEQSERLLRAKVGQNAHDLKRQEEDIKDKTNTIRNLQVQIHRTYEVARGGAIDPNKV